MTMKRNEKTSPRLARIGFEPEHLGHVAGKLAGLTDEVAKSSARVKVLEEALEELLATTALPDVHKKDCHCAFCVARTTLSRSRGAAG